MTGEAPPDTAPAQFCRPLAFTHILTPVLRMLGVDHAPPGAERSSILLRSSGT